MLKKIEFSSYILPDGCKMTVKNPQFFSLLPILKISNGFFMASEKPGSRFPLMEIPCTRRDRAERTAAHAAKAFCANRDV